MELAWSDSTEAEQMIQTKPTEVGASDNPPIKQSLSFTDGKHLSQRWSPKNYGGESRSMQETF